MRKKTAARYIAEGREAFTAALTTNDCPYPRTDPKHEEWLHGWWSAYYKQRDALMVDGKLCGYCAEPLDNVTTGSYVVGKHGTTKIVCGKCKTELVRWDDYQVMVQAKSLS